METISHQTAQALIQRAADKKIAEGEKKLLEGHLINCLECGKYAERLNQLEADLTQVFHARWGKLEPQISHLRLLEKAVAIRQRGESVKTLARMAIAPALMLTFILAFFALEQRNPGIQFGQPAPSASSPALFGEPQQTPSPPVTQIKENPTVCHAFPYLVQENDTLVSIALKFGVSVTRLQEENQLTSETLRVAQELNIPVCEPPYSTTTPTTTSTLAPLPELASPTPPG